MRAKSACWLSLHFAILFGAVPFALADYTITVTIGDTTLGPVTNGPVTIPEGTYNHAASGGSVTIANSGGTAQVVFTPVNDATEDGIRLINMRITAANASVTNFPISFQGQMAEGPDTPTNTVYYKMKAVGVFQQATGSSFLIGDYLQNPLTEGFTFLQQVQYTPGNIAFTINPSGAPWPPYGHVDLSGDRVLRVETAVKLANGKWLDFNTTNNNRFIQMYNSTTADQCGGDPDCQTDVPSMYLPGLLKWSDCHGKKSWICRWFGIWCPALP